jgi:uncharacterized membrane protein
MTTKRTHGPCNCYPPPAGGFKHEADCPSLYPAQQEPDALTRLARFHRDRVGRELSDADSEKALSLISEAREEQREAVENAAQTAGDTAAAWDAENGGIDAKTGPRIAAVCKAIRDLKP